MIPTICTKCRKPSSDSAVFCGFCGNKFNKTKHCTKCNLHYNENTVYCEMCGEELKESAKSVLFKPAAPDSAFKKPSADSGTVASTSTINTGSKGIKGLSMYDGDPKIGLSRSIGDLLMHQDKIVYIKKLDNADFASKGISAMIASAKSSGAMVEKYGYTDIKSVDSVLYGNELPGISVRLKSDRLFSLVGTKDKETQISKAIEFINQKLK